MDEFERVPEILHDWIPWEDPFRLTKYCQIKYWWHAFSDIYRNCNLDKVLGVLSSEDCWRRVDNLHGVKLDRQVLGERLYAAPLNYNLVSKFKLLSRFCLEDDMADLIHESKGTMSFEDFCNSYATFLKEDCLVNFWLHFLEGRISSIKPDYLHVLEYGFACAIQRKQALAMEFFWTNIITLPEDEMKNETKEKKIFCYAVYTAEKYISRPEIFEFCFKEIKPERYSVFLEKAYSRSNTYLSLTILLVALRFEEFKGLFDCLMPNSVSGDLYCCWIHYLGMNIHSGRYMDAAVGVFKHMWEKTGFDEHRTAVHNQLITNEAFQTHLLEPLIIKGYADVVWKILDRATPGDIKRYMNSENSYLIDDLLLEMNDNKSICKFLSYRVLVK